ncbi:hypothetical protein [Glutamicibacter protophormiae]
MMPAPHLWLNGRQITGRATDRAPVLAPLTLEWGSDSHIEQPKPADLKFTILFRDSMADIPDLINGAQVELVDPYANRPIFVGAIRSMSSKPSNKVKGALEVTAHCTDYTADLESLFISTDWPSSVNRPTQLRYEFIEQGWTVSIPDDPTPSAELKLNSIKLMTVLERFISRWRGHRYDTSWRDKITGELHKQVGVFKGNARRMRADKLTTDTAGRWNRRYTAPLVEGEYSPILNIPASNILLDPEWTQDTENCVTIVNLSTTGMGEDGFSTLTERTFKAPAPVLQQFGHRAIELETDLLNPSDWAACAAEWMDDDSPWNVSELTVRDTDELDQQVVADLLAMVTRYKTLVIVTGILANRPDPGPSDYRSYLLGGTYTWTGKKWEMSLRMERTITKLDGAGDWWTCERVAASTTLDIANATCLTVGNELTVADFRFIGEP